MKAADYAYFDVPFAAYAHRGGATYRPNLHRENSLHAFHEAVALGYRYLETDVHATRDGVLLAFHDGVLDRVTNRPAYFDPSYAQVAEARIHGIDPIPRLSELLVKFLTRIQHRRRRTRPWHSRFDHRRVRGVRPGLRQLIWNSSHPRTAALSRLASPSEASALGIANRFLPWLTCVLNSSAPVLQMPISVPMAGRRLTVLTPSLVEAVHRAGKRTDLDGR
jgi:glycerophosphoryl diester phosphodiesterase